MTIRPFTWVLGFPDTTITPGLGVGVIGHIMAIGIIPVFFRPTGISAAMIIRIGSAIGMAVGSIGRATTTARL